ncbi:MAG TPA: hypothetical protein VIH90_03030 [Candidatus Saccharimonadales bacterium]
MNVLRHIPRTESWKRDRAEKLRFLWSENTSFGHEITLPDDPKEARDLIDTTLSEDAPYIDLAGARTEVSDALEEGPRYNLNILCLGYDDEGNPSVVLV